ncbi:ABC transporter ATP-binding protein [Candidatus Formimonas warabiya]|uniref:Bacitracin ABC transporter ATP-binding protein n=1 Tax=Formimonas warabiya TaxID=1761012 RepID=A0A3G1KM82_FORW1|nr:ABC transporter ATP-binding protein [Candidatus Formimonas warabiya]ATW23596.1 bacitracin ABC transporter ATP-binding protein [Candidatus Formimonas warabiya]
MTEILNTKHLTKRYGKVTAVSDLSLNVGEGEIYGFLGLNGAGKTTTIRMLLGMIRPSSGNAFLFGKRIHAGAYDLWRDVGYLVEMPYSYPELSVRENLEIVFGLRGLKEPDFIDRIMEKLKLQEYADRQVKHLSLGNAQRLGLAKALIHNPRVLLLDEPSNGLDPAGIVEIRDFLLDLAQNHGVTIFISSHILSEISRLASRIGIIHSGRLLQELDSATMEKSRRKRLLLKGGDNGLMNQILAEAGFAVTAAEDGGLQTSDARAVEKPEMIARLLAEHHCYPKSLYTEVEDLESYFLRMIGAKEEKAL